MQAKEDTHCGPARASPPSPCPYPRHRRQPEHWGQNAPGPPPNLVAAPENLFSVSIPPKSVRIHEASQSTFHLPARHAIPISDHHRSASPVSGTSRASALVRCLYAGTEGQKWHVAWLASWIHHRPAGSLLMTKKAAIEGTHWDRVRSKATVLTVYSLVCNGAH